MHPRAVREKLLHVFWLLLAGGVVLTAPLFGTAWLQPERWITVGIGDMLVVILWAILGWIISRRYLVIGEIIFLCGLIPFLVYSTGSSSSVMTQLDLQPASRIALMSPLELFLGVLGGVGGAVLGLVVIILSFWGLPFHQLIITGHQLLLFAIFGILIHQLLNVLEQRHDRLEALNSQLEQAALTDPATGLGNRRALERDWQTIPRSNTSFALWDIDGLKRINDTQGHQAGDAFITAFCLTLQKHCQPTDKLYRVGGDEFISIHPNQIALETLINTIRADFTQVSTGWIQLEQQNLDAALFEADTFMYKDKQSHHAQLLQVIKQ